MKKALLSIVVLFLILHPKNTPGQERSILLQSEITPNVYPALQINLPSDSFFLDENGMDLADENINDPEKKSAPFQNVAQRATYSEINPICRHTFNSKGVTQSLLAFESSLHILYRVIRI